MTPDRLSEIEKRLEAATPGPWSVDPRNLFFYDGDTLKPPSNALYLDPDGWNSDWLGADVVGPTEPGRSTFTVRDAWFIANAPTDIALLLRLVRLYELELRKIGRAVDQISARDVTSIEDYIRECAAHALNEGERIKGEG